MVKLLFRVRVRVTIRSGLRLGLWSVVVYLVRCGSVS